MTMTIKYISDKEAQVTKAFAKKAVIFGTEEYKLWREYRNDFPEAKMVTKSIKKNPNKKINTKNMTYQNMISFIKEQENSETLKKEFDRQVNLSKIQTNPYRAVLAWFMEEFKGYDSYKTFFENLDTTPKANEAA